MYRCLAYLFQLQNEVSGLKGIGKLKSICASLHIVQVYVHAACLSLVCRNSIPCYFLDHQIQPLWNVAVHLGKQLPVSLPT